MLTNTRPDMKVVREEIFGPVVVAAPFTDLDEIAARRERHRVRPRRGHLDPGHLQGPRPGQEAPGRHRLDQLLQRVRRVTAVRRVQAVRLGPRDGPRGPRGLHRSQGRHHPAVNSSRSPGGRTGQVRPPRLPAREQPTCTRARLAPAGTRSPTSPPHGVRSARHTRRPRRTPMDCPREISQAEPVAGGGIRERVICAPGHDSPASPAFRP